MPRYFFHTHLGEDVITDLHGADLRDADHAWETAKVTIQASLSDPKNHARLLGARLVVMDEAGDVVLEFPFAEAVTSPTPTDGTRH